MTHKNYTDYWLYYIYNTQPTTVKQTNTVLNIFYLRQTAQTQATSFYVNTFVDDVFTSRKLCYLTQVNIPNLSQNNNDH